MAEVEPQRAPDREPRHPLPQRSDMEQRFAAKVVTFENRGEIQAGGMCSCCGSGPNPYPDWRDEPWYVYRAGLCDVDGVFYSMLCEGCLEDIRAENADRPTSQRDEIARVVSDLLGDDLDGAQSMMDDF